jgi:hypothetical protein
MVLRSDHQKLSHVVQRNVIINIQQDLLSLLSVYSHKSFNIDDNKDVSGLQTIHIILILP